MTAIEFGAQQAVQNCVHVKAKESVVIVSVAQEIHVTSGDGQTIMREGKFII